MSVSVANASKTAKDFLNRLQGIQPSDDVHPLDSSPSGAATTKEGLATAATSSFETAFKLMFASCTNPDPDVPISGDDYTDSSNSGRKKGPPTEVNVKSPLRTGGKPSGTGLHPAFTPVSNRTSPVAGNKKEIGEHIYEHLFFDDPLGESRNKDGSPTMWRKDAGQQRVAAPSTPPNGNTSNEIHLPLRVFPATKPQSFPHVAPTRMPAFMTATEKEAPAPQEVEEFKIQTNFTFDDGISAISAHTLEAMEKARAMTTNGPMHGDPENPQPGQILRVTSPKSTTHFPHTAQEEVGEVRPHVVSKIEVKNTKSKEKKQIKKGDVEGKVSRSPFNFNRMCNHKTRGTKASPQSTKLVTKTFPQSPSRDQKATELLRTPTSKSSKSSGTRTTESCNSFENWHQEQELKYWEDVVATNSISPPATVVDSRKGRNSKRLNQEWAQPALDNTLFSSNGLFSKNDIDDHHPHESFAYEPSHWFKTTSNTKTSSNPTNRIAPEKPLFAANFEEGFTPDWKRFGVGVAEI